MHQLILKKTILRKIGILCFCYTILIACVACSSGTTSSDTPPNIGGNAYSGTYTSSNNADTGSISFNLTQSDDGTITGLVVINSSRCLSSGSITQGSINGFNVNIQIAQPSGTLDFALTASNNRLSGSYALSSTNTENASTCSGDTISGSIQATR